VISNIDYKAFPIQRTVCLFFLPARRCAKALLAISLYLTDACLCEMAEWIQLVFGKEATPNLSCIVLEKNSAPRIRD